VRGAGLARELRGPKTGLRRIGPVTELHLRLGELFEHRAAFGRAAGQRYGLPVELDRAGEGERGSRVARGAPGPLQGLRCIAGLAVVTRERFGLEQPEPLVGRREPAV